MKKEFVPKPPYPRRRTEGSIQRTLDKATYAVTTGASPGTTITTNYPRLTGYSGTRRECEDVVTPGYSKLINEGRVINNPFRSITQTCEWGGRGPTMTRVSGFTPWSSGRTDLVSNSVYKLHYDPEFMLAPFVDSDDHLYIPPSIVDVDYLLRKTKTKALSKVDQSQAQVITGLAELKATLLGLINPLASIAAFTDRFQFRKYNYRKKTVGAQVASGRGLLPAAADQYLSFYYGLKPFMKDLESYLDAYINQGLDTPRTTARSALTETKTDVRSVLGNPANMGATQWSCRFTRTDTVTVRTGIMYAPTPNTYSKMYGLRAMDIFGSMYQATPWSFFLDYFTNIGTLIEALTPRTGVTYLASWETINYEMTWSAETLDSWIKGDFAHTSKGTEWAKRTLKASVRSPVSPFVNVGPVAFTGIWDSKMKVMAVLSLIIQQLSKKLPIINF